MTLIWELIQLVHMFVMQLVTFAGVLQEPTRLRLWNPMFKHFPQNSSLSVCLTVRSTSEEQQVPLSKKQLVDKETSHTASKFWLRLITSRFQSESMLTWMFQPLSDSSQSTLEKCSITSPLSNYSTGNHPWGNLHRRRSLLSQYSTHNMWLRKFCLICWRAAFTKFWMWDMELCLVWQKLWEDSLVTQIKIVKIF